MNYYNPYNNTAYPYQYQYQYYQPAPAPTAPTLNGKIVDSIDVARATDVAIGSYGVFPKADLSEVYIKSWNNNGTTNIVTYRPAEASPEAPEVGFPQLIERINVLESKLDSLLVAAPSSTKKAEVKLDEY